MHSGPTHTNQPPLHPNHHHAVLQRYEHRLVVLPLLEYHHLPQRCQLRKPRKTPKLRVPPLTDRIPRAQPTLHQGLEAMCHYPEVPPLVLVAEGVDGTKHHLAICLVQQHQQHQVVRLIFPLALEQLLQMELVRGRLLLSGRSIHQLAPQPNTGMDQDIASPRVY